MFVLNGRKRVPVLIRPNAPSSILRVKEEIDQKESLKVKPDLNPLHAVPEPPVEAKAAAKADKAEAVKVGALRGMDPGVAIRANLGASLQGRIGKLKGEGLKGKTKAL